MKYVREVVVVLRCCVVGFVSNVTEKMRRKEEECGVRRRIWEIKECASEGKKEERWRSGRDKGGKDDKKPF